MHTLHRPLTETNNIPNKNPHILKKINYLMEVTSLNDLIQLKVFYDLVPDCQ